MTKNNKIIKATNVQDKICTIRGMQVMLDRDLAELYQVKTIRLREQVKRNKKKFPIDFMFQLTVEEVDLMVSQNAIPSRQHLGGHLPYVFTEHGTTMLASILKSDVAIETSIRIIRAFVQMRKFLTLNAGVFSRLENVEQKQIKTDKKVDKILDALEDKTLKPKQGIFYDGQIFDAYVFVANLINDAKKSIVLIDNYIDESVLQLFRKRKKNVSVIIYTQKISKVLKQDLQKFNEQYLPIKIKTFKKSHDRFIIIDEDEMYHIGASLKDLGKKWFGFSKFDKGVMDILRRLG
jgi:hypothetical protein